MGRPFFSARYLVVFSSIVAFGIASVSGQPPAPPKPAAPAAGPQQGIYLVFPFENAGVAPRLEWLGEGLEELTIQRLSAAGEQVYSHAGRLVELERYGLPHTSKFSRATMLHVAEDLDADFVIYGRFSAKGTSLTIESRILRVNPTSLMPALRETGTLDSLMDLHTRLVWRMLSANERKYRLNLADFTRLRVSNPTGRTPTLRLAKRITRGVTTIRLWRGFSRFQNPTTAMSKPSLRAAFAASF